MNQNAVSRTGVSPDFKQGHGDILSMAVSPPLNEESFQEEIEESDAVEPNLKDIHNLLKNIQSAITAMQGNIAMLAKDNNKLSSDVAELRKVIAKNNEEVEKLKKDLVSQNRYVASLELYQSEMMKLAIEKRREDNILSTWSLDGKISIKTSPSGRPRQMFSIDDVNQL